MNIDDFYSEKGMKNFYDNVNRERKRISSITDGRVKEPLIESLNKSIKFYERGRIDYLNSVISMSKIKYELFNSNNKKHNLDFNLGRLENSSFSKN